MKQKWSVKRKWSQIWPGNNVAHRPLPKLFALKQRKPKKSSKWNEAAKGNFNHLLGSLLLLFRCDLFFNVVKFVVLLVCYCCCCYWDHSLTVQGIQYTFNNTWLMSTTFWCESLLSSWLMSITYCPLINDTITDPIWMICKY